MMLEYSISIYAYTYMLWQRLSTLNGIKIGRIKTISKTLYELRFKQITQNKEPRFAEKPSDHTPIVAEFSW